MNFPGLSRLILSACLLLSACTSSSSSPTPVPPLPIQTEVPSPTPPPQPFRVIGYATDAITVELIPYRQLTHINFAFLLPRADGTFEPLLNSSKTKNLVNQGHANGVKVLISIGGWGLDSQFEELAASSQTRSTFVENTLKVLDEYGFDGVDIDWEYPDPGQSAQNYLALIRELRTALPDKLLTTAIIAYGDETGLGIPRETFDLLDFINVMAYDGPDHASLEQFQKSLDYWLNRGISPEKLVMGIPFYSRPGEIPFRKLIKNDPTAGLTDIAVYNGEQQRYNGRPSVQKKTRIALERTSGIMFWALEHDASGQASLLNAIYQVISNQKP